jgi:hypothetical protein
LLGERGHALLQLLNARSAARSPLIDSVTSVLAAEIQLSC